MEKLTDEQLKATLEAAERWEKRRVHSTVLSDVGYFRDFYPQLIEAMAVELTEARAALVAADDIMSCVRSLDCNPECLYDFWEDVQPRLANYAKLRGKK